DVEDRRARYLLRMIKAHAVQDAGTAIVPGRVEFVEAKRGHHLNLILRHGPERVTGVIRTARWLLGIAIATQIGRNDGELACQRRRDLVPVQVREGIAVHQQQGRTASTRHRDNTRTAGLDFRSLEAVEHGFRMEVVRAFEASITNSSSRQEAMIEKKSPASR